MKKLLKKFLEMFPLRTKRYSYLELNDQMVFVRSKTTMFILAFVALCFCMLLNRIGRPSSKKGTTAVIGSAVSVDRSRSFSELVAANRFDTIAMDDVVISERSNIVGQYKVPTRLFPLKSSITNPNGLTEYLNDQGYRSANEDELLAWGMKNPEEQLKYAIQVSPESDRADGMNCRYLSVALYGNGGKRGIKTNCRGFPYLAQETYVLAVKK